MKRVFVYGSLKRGMQHHGQLGGARFVRTARLFGSTLVLYDDGYPALVTAAPDDHVEGEVYEVDEAHLTRLDEFEECPTLYQRTAVWLDDGTSADAYLISTERAAHLPHLGARWDDKMKNG